MKKFLIGVFFLFLIFGLIIWLGFLWLKNGAYNSIADISNVMKNIEIEEGLGTQEIGEKLERNGLIENKYFFYYYLWKNNDKQNSLQAGKYELAPKMTIPQIVEKLSKGEIKITSLKITIPEGFTNKKIIERLKSLKPSITDEFAVYANCRCLGRLNCQCDKFSQEFSFLKDIPNGIDMEGYLFPDTYFIEEEDTAEILMRKMLSNFKSKLRSDLMEEISSQGKKLFEIITMASIIEREVKTDEDRKIVSGIFWRRITDEHPLQSCATLAYILGLDKPQFSFEDTRQESPYNTYINPGLPPGPICNPGLASIKASIEPNQSEYYYFLSRPEDEKIIYSKTIDEHNLNKQKYGL